MKKNNNKKEILDLSGNHCCAWGGGGFVWREVEWNMEMWYKID